MKKHSDWRLKDEITFKVNYTAEDIQKAYKNKEISEEEYKTRMSMFERVKI